MPLRSLEKVSRTDDFCLSYAYLSPEKLLLYDRIRLLKQKLETKVSTSGMSGLPETAAHGQAARERHGSCAPAAHGRYESLGSRVPLVLQTYLDQYFQAAGLLRSAQEEEADLAQRWDFRESSLEASTCVRRKKFSYLGQSADNRSNWRSLRSE